MRTLPGAVLAIIALIMGVAVWVSAGDRVTFTAPATGNEIGVLVDGKRSGTDVKDEVHTCPSGSALELDNLEAGTSNEVVVFQRERMVTLQSAEWTSGTDELTVTQQAEQGVSVAIWFLKEFNSVAFNRAAAACGRMGQIWQDECMGLRISSIEFHKEALGTVDSFLDFDCSGEGCTQGEQLLADLLANGTPPVDGMLNIYYVDTVDWGAGPGAGTNGVWCGNNMIVMGRTARVDLMVHEVGHALELDHTDSMSGFSDTNVMWSVSNTRAYFTEGQTFRAHLDGTSVINSTYGLRATTAPIRTCGTYGGSSCPDLALRIWPDTP